MWVEAIILDHLPFAILQVDQEGRLKWWNRVAAEFFELSREEAAGKIFFELLKLKLAPSRPEVIQLIRETLALALTQGQSGERVLEALDGQWIHLWCYPLSDPQIEEPGALFVLEDITAQKSRQKQHLERERLLGVVEMASSAAHKLNQPLQVIMGYVSLMMLDLKSDHPHYTPLAKMLEQLEKVQKITTKLSNITSHTLKKNPHDQRLLDIDQASVIKDPPWKY